jgi:hypothetical protein
MSAMMEPVMNEFMLVVTAGPVCIAGWTQRLLIDPL